MATSRPTITIDSHGRTEGAPSAPIYRVAIPRRAWLGQPVLTVRWRP
jgi:hypothetical protein